MTMTKGKKIFLIAGGAFIALVVVLMLSLGQIIKAGVNTMGPKLAGVPVRLDHAVMNPLTGLVRIKGLLIGNPEGFKTPSAMELNDFRLKIKLSSLFTDVIVIEEILISGPQITYERGLRDSNLSRLQDVIASAPAEPAPEPAKEKPAREKGPAKKVLIENFELNGAKVNVSLTALGGRSAAVPLPTLTLQNIGGKSGGATATEAVSEILRSITRAVVDVAASAGGMVKDAGGASAEAAKEAAGSLIKGVGGLLGK